MQRYRRIRCFIACSKCNCSRIRVSPAALCSSYFHTRTRTHAFSPERLISLLEETDRRRAASDQDALYRLGDLFFLPIIPLSPINSVQRDSPARSTSGDRDAGNSPRVGTILPWEKCVHIVRIFRPHLRRTHFNRVDEGAWLPASASDVNSRDATGETSSTRAPRPSTPGLAITTSSPPPLGSVVSCLFFLEYLARVRCVSRPRAISRLHKFAPSPPPRGGRGS